jgi:hypothetical protein
VDIGVIVIRAIIVFGSLVGVTLQRRDFLLKFLNLQILLV